MSQVSSKSVNDAVLAIDRLTKAINGLQNLSPILQQLVGISGDSNNLDTTEVASMEEDYSSKTLFFNEKDPKEIRYCFRTVSSLSDNEKSKQMNLFMELYLLALFVCCFKEKTEIVVVPALFSTTGKETAFDVHTIMNGIVKEKFNLNEQEEKIGTMLAVIVDGFDYFTCKSSKGFFSMWDLTIYHPSNRTPSKSVITLAKECFSRIRNVATTDYDHKPPILTSIVSDATSQMFHDRVGPFKSVKSDTGDNPAFKFISAAMMVHVYINAALLERNPQGEWDIIRKMEDIVANMMTHTSVNVLHKRHLSALPPLFIHCWNTLEHEFKTVVTVKTVGSPDLSQILQDSYEFLGTCEQKKAGSKKGKRQNPSPQPPNSAKKGKAMGKKSSGMAGEC